GEVEQSETGPGEGAQSRRLVDEPLPASLASTRHSRCLASAFAKQERRPKDAYDPLPSSLHSGARKRGPGGERDKPHPVGGASSSNPFCRASGPSCVTDTAAINSKVARHANTVVRPQPLGIQRMVGRMNAVASRP